jgi:hypothetical protein
VTYEDLLRAFSCLTIVSASDLPQSMVEFLYAFGYARPARLLGFVERTRDIDPIRLRHTFVRWLEERGRVVEANEHFGQLPDWSAELPDAVDAPAGHYGVVAYTPSKFVVESRGPSPIQHNFKQLERRPTFLHVLVSTAPFMATVKLGTKAVMTLRGVLTSRSWVQSRFD